MRKKEDGVRRKWIGLHKYPGGRSNDGVTMRLIFRFNLCLDIHLLVIYSSSLFASLRFFSFLVASLFSSSHLYELSINIGAG